MKKYGKLIIAFMWLGLTMIMIVGATFAWFAENRNVDADGMEIKAETVKNLLISSDGTNYATSADISGSVTELAPASSETAASDSTFFAAVDATRSNGYIDAVSGAINDDSDFANPFRAANINSLPQNGEQHIEVVKYEFFIKTDSSSSSLYDLYVSAIDVTNESDAAAASDISKALRVAVVCGSNHYIFAPVTGHTASYKAIAAITPDNPTLSTNNVVLSAAGLTAGVPNCILANTVTDSATTVYVYVWYEGQDANCTSAASADVEELTVKVTFAALDASSQNNG